MELIGALRLDESIEFSCIKVEFRRALRGALYLKAGTQDFNEPPASASIAS
jgi:hypothetical protein